MRRLIAAGFTIGLALALDLCLALPSPAWAYLDPNTGNLIFQILFPVITFITTALLFFRNAIRRLIVSLKEMISPKAGKKEA
ncbi:MAG: hypothetical protein QME75_15935 [Deltaproteobacteria bacterium]|nr:hypothetical protein [Deltaproteobacteria bacterium]